MRVMKIVSCMALLLLIGAVAAPVATQPAEPVTWATTMPAIELSNQPLEKVLNEIKAKLPGFDFSISRENVPHDYPNLPKMDVENISLEQFVQLVSQQIPGVTISESSDAGVFGGSAGIGSVFCKVNVTPNSVAPEAVVRVFSLGEHLQASKGDDGQTKKATDDVLSLIQAALDVDGETPPPTMKLHAPTQTLIFKGSEHQAEIVSSALAALKLTPATTEPAAEAAGTK